MLYLTYQCDLFFSFNPRLSLTLSIYFFYSADFFSSSFYLCLYFSFTIDLFSFPFHSPGSRAKSHSLRSSTLFLAKAISIMSLACTKRRKLISMITSVHIVTNSTNEIMFPVNNSILKKKRERIKNNRTFACTSRIPFHPT